MQTILKIEKNFYLLSKIKYVVWNNCFCPWRSFRIFLRGFRGVLISLLVADIVCIASISRFTNKIIPELNISFQMYLELLKIGIPLMILFFLILLLASVDKTLILALISEEALGYFGVATVATTVIATIPQAIHSVTQAPIMEKFGRTKDRERVKNYFIEPMVLMAYIIPVLIACLNYSIHLPILYYLDKYVQSITVMKILTIGVFFEAVSTPAMSIALAFNKQVKLIFLLAPLVALHFGLTYLFIIKGWGLNGVAIGTSITSFLYFLVLIFYAFKQFGAVFTEVSQIIMMIVTPFLYALALYFFIEYFVPVSISGFWSDILYTSLKIFSLLCCTV